MDLEIGALSDVGRRRRNNEDSLAVHVPEDPAVRAARGVLCLVADGMGGHAAGEVASRLAVQTVVSTYYSAETEDPAAALDEGIRKANQAVFETAEREPSCRGMGTTLACAIFLDGRMLIANVGDSPIFLLRGGSARQLTSDHTWVAEQVALGYLTEEQAAHHPYRHVLTRSLGIGEEVEAEHYPPVILQPDDVVVVCSDGLTEHVAPAELVDPVTRLPAQEAATALVALANDRGGADNTSVIVAKITG